ncbi:MAG: ATP-binding protein [Ferruginibacter sp.]
MGQSEITILIIISNIILLIFIGGIIIFIFQYRKRRVTHNKEKEQINLQHQQELLTTQLQSQQQTMQHIGTEIHDNVGQKLTLASLYSKQITAGTSNLEKKINAIGNIIDEALSELRQLSKTLTNPDLANAGLLVLLNEEAKRINASGICFVTVKADKPDLALTQGQKNILLRLLQEFIQNSLKHAGCRKIEIEISKENNSLSIMATDDGTGFDTNTVSTGIGLQNMKRRAEQLNAIYDLQSEGGKGTTLHVQFQLN